METNTTPPGQWAPATQPPIQEETYSLGNIQVRQLLMGDIGMADCSTPATELDMLQHVNDHACVEMNFVLEGQIRQRQEGLFREQDYFTGYHNILFNPGAFEQNRFLHRGAHHTLGIYISPARFISLFAAHAPLLETAASNITAGRPFVLHQPHSRITPLMRHVMASLWNCPLEGGLRKLYLESKVMELMALQCDGLTLPDIRKRQAALTNAEDVEKIYQAHSILLQRADDPPSLAALSRLCGLNEFKLKKGFRETFHYSVFGYLQMHRLSIAREQVLHTRKTLMEIALETGFAHVQHFNRAFKKQFGITPGQMRK